MKFSSAIIVLSVAVNRVSAQYTNTSVHTTSASVPVSYFTTTEDITKVETVTVVECCSDKCSPRVTTEVHTTTEICKACQQTTVTNSYVTTKGSSVVTVYSPHKTAIPTTTGVYTVSHCAASTCVVHESTYSTIPKISSVTVHGSCDACKASSHLSSDISSHASSPSSSHAPPHASSNSSSHAAISSSHPLAHISSTGSTNHTTAAHIVGGASRPQMAGSFLAIVGAVAVLV